jgi:predicted helicase
LKERSPDGSPDENVFDILQGVGVSFLVRTPSGAATPSALTADLFGVREKKYAALGSGSPSLAEFVTANPGSPNYFLSTQDEVVGAEYDKLTSIPDLFEIGGLGFQSHRDKFVVAFSRHEITDRMKVFFDLKLSDDAVKERFGINDYRRFKVGSFRRSTKFDKNSIRRIQYRPFDYRYVYYARDIVQEWQIRFHGHLLKPNRGLNVMRQTKAPTWQHVMASETPTPAVFVEVKDGSSQFPLYRYGDADDSLLSAQSGRTLESFRGSNRELA